MIAALALFLASAAAPTTQVQSTTTPAATQAPPAPPTRAQLQSIFQQLGFSPTAIAMLVKASGDDTAIAQAVAPDIRAGAAAVVGAIQATPFNESNLETQLRNQQTRISRARDQSFQRQVATLHGLPAGDQLLYAKLIVFGVRRNPAPTAAGADPAQPPKK